MNASRYPYVVVRYMPAVFQERSLPASLSRDEIVALVLAEVQRTRLRMCCVFAAGDCVYCEPDGTTRASDDPPSGGALLTPSGVVNRSR